MIIVSGTLKLGSDHLETVRAKACETVEATRREAGCIVYSFAEDLVEPGLIRIYEEWESREALAAHGQTPHIASWREALAAIEAPNADLKLVEIASAEPFA